MEQWCYESFRAKAILYDNGLLGLQLVQDGWAIFCSCFSFSTLSNLSLSCSLSLSSSLWRRLVMTKNMWPWP